MSVSPLDTTQTHSALQKQGMEVQQRNITSLGGSMLSEAEKSEKLRDACEGFESIFIQKMWQQMRATLPKENPLVGREEKFWQGLYDQELSKKMAESGGIGLADMMYEQLARNLLSASSATATSVSATTPVNSGFNIDAVPLMPRQHIPPLATSHAVAGAESQTNDTVQATRADQIYEGAASHVGGQDPSDGNMGTVSGALNPVQQFVSALQQKQAPQGDSAVANALQSLRAQQGQLQGTGAGGMTPAQLAQYQAGSQSGQGILPPSPHAQVVRTVYTTNMPHSTRGGSGEKAHQEVMRNLDAARMAEQVAAINNLQNGQPLERAHEGLQGTSSYGAGPNAPVLTAADAQTPTQASSVPPMGTTQPTSLQPTAQPLIQPTVQPVIQPTIQPVITEQGIINQGTMEQGMSNMHVPTPSSPAQPTLPLRPDIRPIVPAGSIVSNATSLGGQPIVGNMALYDPVTPYSSDE